MPTAKELIIAAQDLPQEIVKVPEWPGVDTVIVRTLTATERDAYEADIFQRNGTDTRVNMTNIRSKLCARCMIDDKGERIFSDREIGILGKKSSLVVDRIFDAARTLNGMSAEDVDDLAKNSEADQSDSSPSD